MKANWRKEIAKNGWKAFNNNPVGTTAEEELEKLQGEVKLLQQERGVLSSHGDQ
jgi:hypothetical protein